MNEPKVIHVVTPESSSGTLWAEVQRLQAVEAESARTIAHLNQTHREVSDLQKARIEELEKALEGLLGFHALTDIEDSDYWCTGCDAEAHIGQELEHEPACIIGKARAVIANTEPKAMTTETQSNEERVLAVYPLAREERHGLRLAWLSTITGISGFEGWYDTSCEAWDAAWEYTEAALEEVRNLKDEIAMMQEGAEVCAADCDDEKQYGPTIRRILARLQSLLDAKSAAMKPEAL